MRQFSAEEVLGAIKEAVGDQYNPKVLPKGQIWWNTARPAQNELDPPTDRQDAFNRIMKKISLEGNNEFNTQYSNMGEGTEINEIIDYAIKSGLIHKNNIEALAPRKYNKYYDSPSGPSISSDEKNRKAAQTLKEFFWARDSLTGANTDGIDKAIGHVKSQSGYENLARVSSNTRMEPSADNTNYKDLTGKELDDYNNTLLDQSKEKLSEEVVNEMEMDIKLQMIAESIKDPQKRAEFMIDTGMATSEQLGNTTIKYDTVGPDMTNRKFAGDNDLARAILASMRSDSPGDNKERALVVDSGGGNVTIGQGVLRSGKKGNGNGNGH